MTALAAAAWEGHSAGPAATETLGRRVATLLRGGDLLLLDGPLGAGKTTFTRGLAAELGVRGPVTSPTFVIAREHPPLSEPGLRLVHVDAYRLSGWAELDDLDLDVDRDVAPDVDPDVDPDVAPDVDAAAGRPSSAGVVVVVEWGVGLAEPLAPSWLHVQLSPVPGEDDGRTVTVRGVGPRWADVDVAAALQG